MITTNREVTRHQMSAAAGALACSLMWLAGTLAIFALQGGGAV